MRSHQLHQAWHDTLASTSVPVAQTSVSWVVDHFWRFSCGRFMGREIEYENDKVHSLLYNVVVTCFVILSILFFALPCVSPVLLCEPKKNDPAGWWKPPATNLAIYCDSQQSIRHIHNSAFASSLIVCSLDVVMCVPFGRPASIWQCPGRHNWAAMGELHLCTFKHCAVVNFVISFLW